jgi:hypothetical protein
MLNSSSNEAHPISKAIRSWQQVSGFVFLLSHCKAQRVLYESSLSAISFPAEKPRLPTNIAIKVGIKLRQEHSCRQEDCETQQDEEIRVAKVKNPVTK